MTFDKRKPPWKKKMEVWSYHHVIVYFLENVYVDHVAPLSGQTKNVASENTFMIKKRGSKECFCVFVADVTNFITEVKKGIKDFLKIIEQTVTVVHLLTRL